MKKAIVCGIVISLCIILFGYQLLGERPQVRYEYTVSEASGPSTQTGAGVAGEPLSVTLLAFGDMMLDRQVRLFINQYGTDYPFKYIEPLIPGNDIVFANLEGSVTYNPSKTADLSGKYLHFTFDPALMPVLKKYGFNVVSLANNHAYDFFRAGYLETQKHLSDAGIAYFGDPYNKENLSVIKEVNGIKVAFVGYHEFYTSTTSPVTAEIARLKRDELADIIIAAPHWGYEYQKNFAPMQQVRGRAFIDAGADIVLGAHPHVIQPIEIYKGKPIFYSLGNFIFDQDFSFDTTHALAVRITFVEEDALFELIPITIQKSQASVSEPFVKEKILADLARLSKVTPELKEEIKKGSFSLTLTAN